MDMATKTKITALVGNRTLVRYMPKRLKTVSREKRVRTLSGHAIRISCGVEQGICRVGMKVRPLDSNIQ